MTSWDGRAETSVRLTGPYAGKVRVERDGKVYLVPRHVFMQVTGNAGLPDMTVHFEWRDGRPQVVDLHIAAKPEGRGVQMSDLDPISLDKLARTVMIEHSTILTDESREGTTSVMPDWQHPAVERDRWALDGALTEAMSSRRGRRAAAELRTVADIYQEFRGRNALAVIAERLDVSERTAARRVANARHAGLITDDEPKG